MGYVHLKNWREGDFQKAVFSIWFRMPQEAVAAALAAYVQPENVADNRAENAPIAPPFNGIVPLVTFGKDVKDAHTVTVRQTPRTLTVLTTVYDVICQTSQRSSQSDGFDENWEYDRPYQLSQSYIGVDVSGLLEDPPTPPCLAVCLQTGVYAQMSGLEYVLSGGPSTAYRVEVDGPCAVLTKIATTPFGFVGNTIFVPDTPTNGVFTFEDLGPMLAQAAPERFVGKSPNIAITPDTWHHCLLSFDLSGFVMAAGVTDADISLESTCKMWVAFDDVNYTGPDLPPNETPFSFLSPPEGSNSIITKNAGRVALSATLQNESFDYVDAATSQWGHSDFTGIVAPRYELDSPPIPMAGQSVGIPATPETSGRICNVQMAEFQMYTGVSADTADESVRRCFIDERGQPVFAQVVDLPLAPAAKAMKLLGKVPDICLHGSKRWIKGQNFGGAGGFEAQGKITPYVPGPKLGE